jgi:hypothetical protein
LAAGAVAEDRHASAVRHQVGDAEKGRQHALPYRVSVLGDLLDGVVVDD